MSLEPRDQEQLIKHLKEMRDEKYAVFQAKLIPTVAKERIIGVRTPALRKYAKELVEKQTKSVNLIIENFLHTLPHYYYEENNLHSYLIGLTCKDISLVIKRVDELLPYVDNWATCDSMGSKIFAKYPEEVLCAVNRWIKSDHVYSIRFGIVTLLQYYLDEHFRADLCHQVNQINHQDYYVRIAQAWYFSIALVKQYEITIPFLTEQKMDKWIHNKTIQKAIESYRIPPHRKEFLRTLRR